MGNALGYILYFAGVGISVAQILLEPPPIPFGAVILVIALGVVGTAMFFLPLNSIHRVMLGEKKRTMEAIRKRDWRAFETVESKVGQNPSLEDLQREVEDVKHTLAFDAAERRASQIPTWPVNTKILARLSAGPSAVILAIVIKFVLDHVSFLH